MPEEITIIAMYTGQLQLLRKKMPKEEFKGVKVASVDNFQGPSAFLFSVIKFSKAFWCCFVL